MNYESLIFDIDGTLWDSRTLVAEGYNIQLRSEGAADRCVTAEALRPLFGKVMTEIADALFPDSGRRVPFGTGTSIFYKNVDYRFRNDTDTPVQLLIWQEEHDLCGELRAGHSFPYRWRIVEEDHHFRRELDGNYYRCSRIYRIKMDCEGKKLDRELLLVNHSKVMYDPALIPPEQLREEQPC